MSFKRVMGLETRRFLDKRKIIILLMFYLLSIYFAQSGISQYKSSLEEIKRFQEFEKERVENFQFYLQYGTYGFRLLYVPGPLSALFENAGIFSSTLNAFIDSGERMKIYEPFKGKDVFISYTSIFLNFSGLLFLLGALLTLFYGLEAYQDKEFLKFLNNITGHRKKLFWVLLISKLSLVLGYVLIIMFSTWFLYLINGLSISISCFIIYGLVVFFMAGFFLLIGMLAGAIKKKRAGIVVVIAAWLLCVFGLPAIVGKIVYKRAESIISAYDIEMKTFKIMMSIEKKAKEQAGQMDSDNTNTKIRQQLYEYFWNNEFKQIFSHEQGMIDDMKEVISLHHNLSLIFPTSFFLSVNNEVSGRGYGNLIVFYEYVLKHKKGFIKYFAEKSFFSGEKEVKPYLKGNENIFYAPSLLPGNFGFGLLIGLFWLLLFLFLNWLAFNRILNQVPDIEESEYKLRKLKPEEPKNNKITYVLTFSNFLLVHFLNTLKGQNAKYIFIPGLEVLPTDIKVKALFSFFGLPIPEKLLPMTKQYYGTLKKDLKAFAIVEIARLRNDKEFIIFNDFLAGLSGKFEEYFLEVLNELKKDCRIIYFTNTMPKSEGQVIRRDEPEPF